MAMKLPIIMALMLAPAGACAQGLPEHPGVDAALVAAAISSVSLSPPADRAVSDVRPRPVRYAQQSVRMVVGTSPESLKLDPKRLPNADR